MGAISTDLELALRSIRVALAGNPNSGKTTVFNNLTGSRQHTGNWPGKTVERKDGLFRHREFEVHVTDLPGIYSLTAYSTDEMIARDFLVNERPDVVVVVVDASNLERNLYLTVLLLELGVNVVLDLNMMDDVRKRGLQIDSEKIARALGVRVVETIANRGIGMDELRDAMVEAALRPRTSGPLRVDYGEEVEGAIRALESEITQRGILAGKYPSRWLAVKLLEGDPAVLNEVGSLPGGAELASKAARLAAELESRLGEDVETYMIERRYGFIKGLVQASVKGLSVERRLSISDRIDEVVTNRVLGVPIFLGLMWATFNLVFRIGNPMADAIDAFFGWLAEGSASLVTAVGAPEWVASLIVDGVIGGIGSVLVFLPNIMLLFLAISILEDSGYMARAAFVMDRVMRAIGLHGKSFISMILGFGCNVPAIMATRSIESEKDRIVTILVNPLMSCSARLPIYVLFASAFFEGNQGNVIFSLYLLGIILAVAVARLLKAAIFKGTPSPFIMELPPYRLPTLRSVFIHMWSRSSLFLRKAGTIIFGTVLLIWALGSLPPGVEFASQQSLAGRLGSAIAPLLRPAGFGSWQAAVALLFGILAKEVVVGTLGTLYGVEEEGLIEAVRRDFTPLSAYAFMVMSLVYIPCIATIAVIRRETNSWKWTAFAVLYSLFLGWALAVLVYQVGRLLGFG